MLAQFARYFNVLNLKKNFDEIYVILSLLRYFKRDEIAFIDSNRISSYIVRAVARYCNGSFLVNEYKPGVLSNLLIMSEYYRVGKGKFKRKNLLLKTAINLVVLVNNKMSFSNRKEIFQSLVPVVALTDLDLKFIDYPIVANTNNQRVTYLYLFLLFIANKQSLS